MTNAYQAVKFGPLLAFEPTEVFGVLCLAAQSRVIGWNEVNRTSVK